MCILSTIHYMAPMPLLYDLVAVQPMAQPSAQVFYLDYVYNTRWRRLKLWIKQWLKRWFRK